MAIRRVTDPTPPPGTIRCAKCGAILTYRGTEIDECSDSYEPDRWDEYDCVPCGIYCRFLYALRRRREASAD